MPTRKGRPISTTPGGQRDSWTAEVGAALPFVDLAAPAPDIVIDIRSVTPDNFMRQPLYPVARCLLRRSVCCRLVPRAYRRVYFRRPPSPPDYAARCGGARPVIVTRLRADGPTLLAAFGMDGATTLAWCPLLAVRYPALLEGERFVMAELIADPMSERPDLSFVERWDVKILLDHRPGAGSQTAA